MDAAVDVKFPNDINLASVFSKVMGHKLSDGIRGDLYTRCRMNCVADTVQKQTPQFMFLGLSNINALYESSGLSNTSTRIRRPTDGAHWSAPDPVFGEATVVGIFEAKSDYDYKCLSVCL